MHEVNIFLLEFEVFGLCQDACEVQSIELYLAFVHKILRLGAIFIFNESYRKFYGENHLMVMVWGYSSYTLSDM